MRVSIALAVVAFLAVAACNRAEKATPPPAPAPAAPAAKILEGYAHDPAFDPQGFYHPTKDVKAGAFKLNHVAMGAPSDFAAWEKGDREAVFGPILFQFDDETSPMATNELGGEYRAVSVRVLPRAYAIDKGVVSFGGVDPKLGEVVFTGTFDQGALAAARQDGAGEKPVLTGILRIGQTQIDDVAFTYFVGD